MFHFHLLLAIRTLTRSRTVSLINLLGLTVAFSALMLILLYVTNEMSYDSYHANVNRIYRVSREAIDQSGKSEIHFGGVNFAFAEYAQKDFSQVIESPVRISNYSNLLLTSQGHSFVEPVITFADSSIFHVFSWKLTKGNKENCLADANSMVISESAAKRYFSDVDPIGKIILIQRDYPVKVTGVFRDIPSNSHYKTDVIVSMGWRIAFEGGHDDMMRNQSNNDATYLLLRRNADIKNLEENLPRSLDNYYELSNDGRKSSACYRYHYWPLKDLHLYFTLDSQTEPNGNYITVYIFTITAALIVMIACVNFINLSTARLSQRAREVGLKKTLGAFRASFFYQFITEALFFVVLSVLIAAPIVYILLPEFNQLVGKSLDIRMLARPDVLSLLMTIIVLVSLIAGGYPAYLLSSFRPAEIIKKGKVTSWRKFGLRPVLVGVQFFFAFTLIISVLIVRKQLNFISHYEIGFNRDNLLVLSSSKEIFNNFRLVKDRLENYPGITQVSLSSLVPSRLLADSQDSFIEENGEMKAVNFRIADVHVDHDYFKVLGIPVVAGRDFDYRLASDSLQSFVLNETAVKALGWKSNDDAIGKQFQYGRRKGNVIGVVKDINFESLHEPLKPVVFVVTHGRARSVLIRFQAKDKDNVLKYLAEQWSFWRPDYPFSFTTLSASIEKQYDKEMKIGEGILLFASFAVLVSSLGVFGLALFMAEQRTKELAIRKVLGARVANILALMSGWFFRLMLVAGVIAMPLSYGLATLWLSTFAFSGGISASPFIWSAIIVVACVSLSIFVQLFRAATQNPVNSLRYE